METNYGGRPDPTKCRNGLHDWVPENIIVHKRQRGADTRSCRVCNNDRKRRSMHALGLAVPGRKHTGPRKATLALIEDYLLLLEQGVPMVTISEKLNRSPDALRQMCKRQGLPFPKEEELRIYRERGAKRRARTGDRKA